MFWGIVLIQLCQKEHDVFIRGGGGGAVVKMFYNEPKFSTNYK